MSIAQLAIGAGVGAGATLFNVLTRKKRSINKDIVAHTVIREVHNDNAVITDHPVEFGSPISDHMYLQPKRLDIEIIYSLSSGINALKTAAAAVGIGSKTKTLTEYYEQFLKLHKDSTLMNVITGKRMYDNMVIESIESTTDVDTENVLRLTLRMREVIIVKTSTTEVPADQQAAYKDTASPIQQNQQQLSSPIDSLKDGFNTYVLSPISEFSTKLTSLL